MNDVEGHAGRFGVLREGLRSAALWALAFSVSMCCMVFFLWGIAFFAYEAVDGYRLSNGLDGESGTVVVDRIKTEALTKAPTCYGTFTPDGGGSPVEVRIEVPGDCETGQQTAARLADERPSLFPHADRRVAWAPGAGDWISSVVILVFVALGAIPFTIGAIVFACISGLALGTEIYLTVSRLRRGD